MSLFLTGQVFGVLFSGVMSDYLGRKITFILFTFVATIFSVATAFAPNSSGYVGLRFMTGFVTFPLFTTVYTYGLEQVGGYATTFFGILFNLPWSFGYALLPAVAYGLPDWKWLQLAVSVPLVLLIPIGIMMPESPRWLLIKGRITEAERIVSRIATFNGKDGSMIKLEPVREDSSDLKANFFDLFYTFHLRKITLLLYFVWFSVALAYYGLSLNAAYLVPGSSLYINFAVSGLVELPAYLSCVLTILFCGRRIGLCINFLLGGIALLCVIAVLNDAKAAMVLSSIGKIGVASAFAILYLYSAEVFPTVLRASGLGSASMWAPLGSIVAPYIGGYLSRKYDERIPMIVFGVLSILCAIACLFLPETQGKKLPNTVEEGEKFAAQDSSILTVFRKETPI